MNPERIVAELINYIKRCESNKSLKRDGADDPEFLLLHAYEYLISSSFHRNAIDGERQR